MIIELKRVTMRQAGGLREGDSARAFPTLSIFILDRHYFIGKIALVHIKVEAVHGNQLDKGDIISLFVGIRYMVSKHKAASFAGVRMVVQKHFEALVLFCLLYHGLASGPDCGVVRFGWVEVHAIQVAGHGVQSVVATRDSIGVQHHDHLENKVIS